MDQIKTIVAATDLSRPALNAARRAALIARDHGARLELLHVIPHPFVSDTWNQVLRRSLAAFARAQELSHAMQAVRRGPASLRIREVARDTAADLIVVGAQGKGAMETALLGSVTLRLVTETPCDVLLARVAG